ncbi:MAG: GNAT family N-acetyltransferase [Promethearchaeota archaeon]
MIIRRMEDKDYEAFKGLFEEAYGEYLKSLKERDPQKYQKELKEERKVTRERFEFYLETGSSFVAEDGEVIGYVVSQTLNFVRGFDRLLWIEYVVVKKKLRRRGIGLALLRKLTEYARRSNVDRIYTTINPDNVASIRLHLKAGFDVKNWRTASYTA